MTMHNHSLLWGLSRAASDAILRMIIETKQIRFILYIVLSKEHSFSICKHIYYYNY